MFGRPSFGRLDLDAIGDGGLRVRCFAVPQLEDRGPPGSGVSYGGAAGGSIARAGDVNRDGYGDVAIGSVGAGPRGRPNAGTVHLVFGGTGSGELDARTLGERGVRIDGPQRASELGRRIVALGDTDGDGHDDLALVYRVGVAAPDGRRLNREELRVAIVFGGVRGGERIDLAAPGDRATVLTGLARGDFADVVDDIGLAALGDVDGDGRADVLVGSAYAGGEPFGISAGVRVIGVERRGGSVDLRRERPIMVVRGPRQGSFATAVASAGDVDGDGRADLAIGAGLSPRALGVRRASGAVVVVPSRPGATVDLARSPAGVWTIFGPGDEGFSFGTAIAPLGDVDGDGRPDLLVGQSDASPDCRHGAGTAWIVPGAAGGGTLAVTQAPGAWRIDGPRYDAGLGGRVAAGDVTGDGLPDLVLPAAPFRDAGAGDVRLVGAQRPLTTLAALPRLDRCFAVRLLTRTLRGLRTGRVVVRVRSNLGTAQRHTVFVRVLVGTLPSRPRTRREVDALEESIVRGGQTTVRARFGGPGRRRIVVRLPPRTRRMLRRSGYAYLQLEVRQSAGGVTWSDEVSVAR